MIVEVPEFTRVEGNGRAKVIIEGGDVKGVKLEIVEGPRFFELMTLGRYYYDVPDLEARICAICYLSHTVASVMAIEGAFDVRVPDEVSLLRELGLLGEMIESHALHLYFLVAPDVFGYPDAIEMASKHASLVKEGFSVKSFGNVIRRMIGGREIHGINVKPGGFARYPSVEEIETLESRIDEVMEAVGKLPGTFASVEPYGSRASVLVATSGYLWGDGLISNAWEGVADYGSKIEESSLDYSFAKQSLVEGSAPMVGALARVLLKSESLTPRAREVFNEYREKLEEGYASYNNLAQAIELVHAVDRACEIMRRLADNGITGKNAQVEVTAGDGVGYVEAPRGVLIHHYKINEEGNVTYSNIITPTAINHAMTESSLYREATNWYGKVPEDELRRRLEMTVRAFDPCISCSVHVVRLDPQAGRHRH